jgi:glycosyltransferase involved in cell wall biosynthesis
VSDGAPDVSSLSVVLPAYDEEDNVGAIVEQALTVLPKLASEWEVIVVDDGSTDRTAAIVSALVVDHHPRVRLLKHPVNEGYGAALRSGFSQARHEFVFYTDADRQFDIAELEFTLPMMREHDVIVGFRVYRYDSPLRLVVSWAYNRLVRIMFRVKVRDVDCAFKVFRREVLDKVTIECTNFFVDTELVAKVRKWNFRVAEKGVRHYPRAAGETKVEPSDVIRTLRVLATMWRRIHAPSRRQVEEAARIRLEVEAADLEWLPAPQDLAAPGSR